MVAFDLAVVAWGVRGDALARGTTLGGGVTPPEAAIAKALCHIHADQSMVWSDGLQQLQAARAGQRAVPDQRSERRVTFALALSCRVR